MSVYLVALYMVLFKFSVALCSTPDEALNKECVDGATASIVLTFDFYQSICPEAEPIIFSWVEKAVSDDPRMAASLLRLHFHDCFVNASHFVSHTLARRYSMEIYFINYIYV